MIGFRDTRAPGVHTVMLEGVRMTFGADGCLWDPTPRQIEVLTGSMTRRERFVAVEQADAPAAAGPAEVAELAALPDPPLEPVYGEALIEGEEHQNEPASPEPLNEPVEEEPRRPRRRARQAQEVLPPEGEAE